MSDRVDPKTVVCRAHDVEACIVCMVDDFHDWLYERTARRKRYKAEWRATPISERFDIGGEA